MLSIVYCNVVPNLLYAGLLCCGVRLTNVHNVSEHITSTKTLSWTAKLRLGNYIRGSRPDKVLSPIQAGKRRCKVFGKGMKISDLEKPFAHYMLATNQIFSHSWGQVDTARGFLLMSGTMLDGSNLPVGAFWARTKTSFIQRKDVNCHLLSFF